MYRSMLALGCVVVSALACSGVKRQPVPPERQTLVGSWSGTGVTLLVTQDGFVHYEETSGLLKVELHLPITGWHEDGFVASLYGIHRTFHIDESPHPEGAAWQTIIDGDLLTR